MLSDDSDGEDIHNITINEHYAKAFEYRKEREELAKLKEKYGSDVDEADADSEDSEDAESEDEDGEELTPAMDAAILRTLARIKRKDPAIYETGKDVFEEERKRTGDVKLSARMQKGKDKSKPITMRQHALASALEDAAGGSRSPSPAPLTHVQEQSMLREETIAAFHTAVEDEDESEDDLLVPREKTKDEVEQEEEEYRAFLQREVGEDLSALITVEGEGASGSGSAEATEEPTPEEGSKKKKKQRNKTKKDAKSKDEEDHEFLMNYILNRGWIDHSEHRLPTYKEITSNKKGKGKAPAVSFDLDDGDSSDDTSAEEEQTGAEATGSLEEDDFDEITDRFESSYNFRFEEPGATEIARHPRNLTSLVRREDTSRKEAREKRKARKEEELLRKREEVKRLKALKMKELRAKLERIGHEGGKKLDDNEALQTLDLEGDWDPEAHDRKMAELYAVDVDGAGDDEKPTWDDDIDITDIIPADVDTTSSKKKKKKKKKKDEDDEDVGVDLDEMDADVDRPRAVDDEEWDGTEEMRRRKLDEYMDEIYGLDFNDVVADIPTRFKYTKVDSQSFGLTPAEILMASDADLNTYMGLRKYAPYRKEGKGRNWDAQRTTRLKDLKQKLHERGVSGRGGAGGEADGGEKVKKRKGKKERQREKAAAAATAGGDGEDGDGDDGGDGDAEVEQAPRKKEKKRKRDADVDDEGDADERQEADDVTSKKKRRRHRKHAAVAT